MTVMLLRFEATNHRSILEPVELSMIAVDGERAATRGFSRISERVLTLASIYGPNASGKSNVLHALSWLADAVAHSLRQWEDVVPREPFRFGAGPERASAFEVEMMVGEVRHSYRIEVDAEAVLYESLSSYPERRRRVLFEREGMNLSFRRGLSAVAGTRDLLTPTTLALSAAMRFDEPEIAPFGRAIAAIGTRNLRRSAGRWTLPEQPSTFRSTQSMFGYRPGPDSEEHPEDAEDRRIALGMLQLADLGIDDVEVVRGQPDLEGYARRRVQLWHRAGEDRLPFDMAEESEGTRTWFALIGPVLSALAAGRPLLFDEIDASLHPRLSAHLLTLFQDPETNPRGAQLIFTTHDTSLLNHLNRDEVWLTEKGDDGATRLAALAEFGGDKVRRSTNLEKAYLQGRFGAVPLVDQFAMRHALGITIGR
jgi:predicted ATPase